ncbi:MAG TPA: hypothetical protein PKH33_01035 [bacterium]|nr:hypothetical protein [bacterium]
MKDDFDISFHILTQISDDFQLEYELYFWHLQYIHLKKHIGCKEQYFECRCGYDSLKDLLNELFDDMNTDFNTFLSSQKEVRILDGLSEVFEDALSAYDWMQLLYKDGKWRISSFYNIEKYNNSQMKNMSTNWDLSLKTLLSNLPSFDDI